MPRQGQNYFYSSTFSLSFVLALSEVGVSEEENTKMQAICTEPLEVRARLGQLGLTEALLQQAVQRGLAAFSSCTENHPRQSPGYYAWSDTVSGLREVLIPLGWHREDDKNLPYTVNESGTIWIIVATGDEFTGRPNEIPCTNSSKGSRTASAVANNQAQYNLFPDTLLTPEDLEKINGSMGRMTWLLLMHRDIQTQEVRCELSRPINMNAECQVSGWAERLILSPMPFLGATADIAPDVPQSPEIDVRVKRRA
jgi:hypothetical protein